MGSEVSPAFISTSQLLFSPSITGVIVPNTAKLPSFAQGNGCPTGSSRTVTSANDAQEDQELSTKLCGKMSGFYILHVTV